MSDRSLDQRLDNLRFTGPQPQMPQPPPAGATGCPESRSRVPSDDPLLPHCSDFPGIVVLAAPRPGSRRDRSKPIELAPPHPRSRTDVAEARTSCRRHPCRYRPSDASDRGTFCSQRRNELLDLGVVRKRLRLLNQVEPFDVMSWRFGTTFASLLPMSCLVTAGFGDRVAGG